MVFRFDFKLSIVALILFNVLTFINHLYITHNAPNEDQCNCNGRSFRSTPKSNAYPVLANPDLIPQQQLKHNSTFIHTNQYNRFLKYDRILPTGLGDRFSVYLCVAAYAYTLNALCYAYWYNEPGNTDRQYDFIEIQKYMTFPSNLIILSSQEEFISKTADIQFIDWQHGLLPSTSAYDGLYTTALNTIQQESEPRVNQSLFLSAYRTVSKQWNIDLKHESIILSPVFKYIVFHMRGSDKGSGGHYVPRLALDQTSSWIENDANTNINNDKYCTYEALTFIHNEHSELPIFLISEDQSAKRRILADFGHVLSMISFQSDNDQIIDKKLFNELKDMQMMMRAVGIIQHAPLSWSAFSSHISAAKSIPLLNTWKDTNKLFNNRGYVDQTLGSIPSEILICEPENTMRQIIEFSKRISIYKQNI